MHVLLTLAYAVLFAIIIWRWRFFKLDGIHGKWLIAIFTLKIGAGLLLWAVYNFHYDFRSDTFIYFEDAMTIRNLWMEDRQAFWSFFWGSGTDNPSFEYVHDRLNTWTRNYNYGLTYDGPTIVRINLIISLFSFGYYHVHTVVMCFISLIGLTAIYKTFKDYFVKKELLLFGACFLIPSVIFWSSGVLKEAPLIMAFGLLVFSIFQLLQKFRRPLMWFVFLISIWLMVFLKEYVLMSMLPAILSVVVCKMLSFKNIFRAFFFVHVICFLVAMNASSFFVGGNFLYVLQKKQTDFYNVTQLVNAQSGIERIDISDYYHFALGYPQALANTYFRPHVLEMKSPFYIPIAIENLLFGCLLLIPFFYHQRLPKTGVVIFLFTLSFVLVIGGIIGYTVPILGAVIRYKIIALPFLAIAALIWVKPFSWSGVSRISNDSKVPEVQ
jgi:hypothetical protein